MILSDVFFQIVEAGVAVMERSIFAESGQLLRGAFMPISTSMARPTPVHLSSLLTQII